MDTVTKKYLKSLYNSIQADLKQLVNKAESMPYTTQNNYDKYLNLLTMLKPQLGIDNASILLKMAEGNIQGIEQAKKIIK